MKKNKRRRQDEGFSGSDEAPNCAKTVERQWKADLLEILRHSVRREPKHAMTSRGPVIVQDLQILRVRYEAASVAFDEIATRNIRQAVNGSRPTDEDFQREDIAQKAFATARRAYMESLREATEAIANRRLFPSKRLRHAARQ
jgi:hypothetical protein